MANTHYYNGILAKEHTENPIWVDHLPRNENGKILLTQPLAIDLALLHSREYQTRYESVYLSALALSGNRFEFDTQWHGGIDANFTATGEDLGNSRSLDVTIARLGLSRNLPGGGQFATDILNSLVWDFGSSSVQAGSAGLVSSFTQPLLRGAFRHVRLESLTQAERDMLYSVRDFARFRRTFYVDIAASYLSLLTQVQALRNLRTNVDVLRQNLVEHDIYVELRTVTQFQRDQVFQQYQSGRLSLLSSEQNLTASLDRFKFQLGLPSWVPLEIDESLLEPFELVDPRIEELQQEAQDLYESMLPFLPPEVASKEALVALFQKYQRLREQVSKRLPEIEEELELWRTRLESTPIDELSVDDALDYQQQSDLAEQIKEILTDLKAGLSHEDDLTMAIRQRLADYDSRPSIEARDAETQVDPKEAAWYAILDGIQKNLRMEVDELYLAQTQIRLFLIDIDPQEIEELPAVSYALENRLDLMNSKARVMDAFRHVEVAADALQSDFSLTGSAALGSDPTRNNAFRLDANNARYTAGIQFDGPLNRLNERNAYRASQIAYQRASRDFMADKDQVSNDVRSVLRQLELARFSFQIARQQLIAATRQVDQAQLDLRLGTSTDSNLTQFLLQALQGLLDAKNNLIRNWIQYRVQKMQLFTALELLYLDEDATWLNEDSGIEEIQQYNFIDPEYFPRKWVHTSAVDRQPAETELQAPDNSSDNSATDIRLDGPRPPISISELPQLDNSGTATVPNPAPHFSLDRLPAVEVQ